MKNYYYLKCLAVTFLFCCNVYYSKSQIVINEIMQSNLNVVMDDLNDYPDSWVELYNMGDKSINLKDYGLGTKSKYSSSYKLPTYTLSPKSYVVIYCDKEGKGLHADFRVESGSKGNLYLYDTSGNVIDEIKNMAAMPSPDVAYGRTTDGGSEWSYLVTPTPMKTNNTSIATNVILPSPLFSVKGGVFTSSFMLSIAKPDDAPTNAVIRYTLDGSEPVNISAVFANGASMNINSTKVVRAKLFLDHAISPMSTTHSYIFHNRKVTLPIISVITDRKNFYDNKIGIYHDGDYSPGTSNYSYNWRRPINFEYFDLDENNAVLNQLCETRVSGGASREAVMKSLIVYSNKRFGKKDFSYSLFNDKPEVPIKSFIMRNSGNDFCWSHFRDAAIQLICHRGGMDLDWQAYQPAIWYLNGSYMGIINLRERSNEDHIYSNYDKLEDIDMFENWWELKSGSWDNLNAFKEFYSKTNNTYEEWEQWMDVSEFMNMLILNTYHINLDFPGNNIVMWRPIAEGGRWRWIIKDTDFGLGLYDYTKYTYNYLNFIFRTGNFEENWANSADATRLFRRLINNNQFKNEFIDRFAVALGDYLCNDFAAQIIDSLKSNIAYEFPYHKSRYSYHGSSNQWLNWDNEVSNMKTWVGNRTNYMYNCLRDYFKLGNRVPVKVNTSNGSSTDVLIYFNENKLSRSLFNGYFYVNREIRLDGQSALSEKEVTGWTISSTINGAQKTETISGHSLKYKIPVGCTNLSFTPILEVKTGIEDNPFNTWKIVKESNGIRLTDLELGSQITLYQVNGQVVHSSTASSDEVRLPLPIAGVYMISVDINQNVTTQKVVF